MAIMTLSARTFRQTIGLLATGVTVVATEVGDTIHGMTANAVTSLSLDPLLMLVCVNKSARMAGFLEKADGFSINVLRDEQRALSTYFAGGWKQKTPPPFRFVPWEGGPRLEGCASAIGCGVEGLFEGGDHWIVVGRVLALHRGVEPIQPLLFFRGRYGTLADGEHEPAPDLGWVPRPVQVFYDPWVGEDT